jgi:hypothetical protein
MMKEYDDGPGELAIKRRKHKNRPLKMTSEFQQQARLSQSGAQS